jgi:hypothetical protein
MGINNINNPEKKEEMKIFKFRFQYPFKLVCRKTRNAFLIPQHKLHNHQHSVLTRTFLVTNYGKTSFINLAISNKACINLNKCYNNKTNVEVQTTELLGIQNHNNVNCKTHTACILK